MVKPVTKKKKSKSTVVRKKVVSKKKAVNRKKPKAKKVTQKKKAKAKRKTKKVTSKEIVKGALKELSKQKKAKKKFDPSKPMKEIKKEEFCQLFTCDREFAGNGVQSYIESHDIILTGQRSYNVARNAASRLLTNANINARISFLIDAELNELQLDKQLAFLVAQNSDLKVKLGAIRHADDLKNRIKKPSPINIPPGSNIETININLIAGKKDG